MTYEKFEKDFDNIFDEAFDDGMKQAEKDIGKKRFGEISKRGIAFNGMSLHLKEFILSGEIRKIDISDDIAYLTKKMEKFNAIK